MDCELEDSSRGPNILNEDCSSPSYLHGEVVWQTVSHKKSRSQPSLGFRPKNDDHRPEYGKRGRFAVLASDGDSADTDGLVGISEEDGSEVSDRVSENGGDAEAKRAKRRTEKKAMKDMGALAVAAAKINAADLRANLVEIEVSSRQHESQLKHLVGLFGRCFATVGASQFACLKLLQESTLIKMIDAPLSHIHKDVYNIVSDWVAQKNPKDLDSFILWCLDEICSDIDAHDDVTTESKNSQAAIFIVLAIVLRRKPDLLVRLLPTLYEYSKYQEQEELPVTVWMIAQASQTDVLVGLYIWVRLLLPNLDGKSRFDSSQSVDLILQLVERILSSAKARQALRSGTVRKGERLVPPSALATLMRLAFPRSSAKVKETERFKAIYAVLKDVALAGSPASKGMKQVTEQMLRHALKAAGEGVRDMSNEASDVFIWCLTQNPDCFKQWNKLYLDNLKASVVVLRKLAKELTEFPAADKHLRQTLRSFTQKNGKALRKPKNAVNLEALLEDSNKYCKEILGESSQSHSHGFAKSLIMVSVAVVLGAAAMYRDTLHWTF